MSFFRLLLAEFKSILTNQAILLTVIGGSLMYSFLYPQPYINQIVKEQKIVLIDLDNSSFSQRFAFLVNSSSGVKIEKKADSLQEAKKNIFEGKAMGYLLIPKDFYKDILLRKRPTVSFGADASYFLIYGTIANDILSVIIKLDEKIKLEYKKTQSAKSFNNTKYNSPIVLNQVPLFNANAGYINYVVPAVFILILHQLMVVGAGILGARQNELKKGYWSEVSTFKLLVAKFLALFMIFSPLVLYYLGFSFNFYGISRLASLQDISFLSVLLILSAISFGVFLGSILKRQELVTLISLITSLPLLFSAGFIWPTFLVGDVCTFIASWFPITPAIMAFLKINQLGVDFIYIKNEISQMALLAIMYFFASWLILRIKYKK